MTPQKKNLYQIISTLTVVSLNQRSSVYLLLVHGCHRHYHLNLPPVSLPPQPRSVEKLSSVKLVPGARKVGDCWAKLCPYSCTQFTLSHMELNRTECHCFSISHERAANSRVKPTLKNFRKDAYTIIRESLVIRLISSFSLRIFQHILQTSNRKFPEGIPDRGNT